MSKIDEKVVKMSFDNKQFETESHRSITTLGRLKDAIMSIPEATGLDKVLGKLTTGDFLKIGALSGGIALLKKGINGIGDTIEGVAHKALNSIEGVFSNALSQIKNGGMSRALKIENAKFMLKGLGLDEETFMKAADYAVSGTAYTLDAAASAAAQFGASGFSKLEDLQYMLRSISGVAAMTNRDFSEISYLWTSMAGLGRVTGMTLTSLSSKGINAAQVLAKALNKTEEEVKDMVHKGQIDFKTFAKAMDDAFGEHAKDANSTFEGASANIQAALSKIGALFATPYIQNIIPTLNGIRIALNAVKDGIANTDVVEKWGNMITKFSTLAEDALQKLYDGLTQTGTIEAISQRVGWIFDEISKIFELVDKKVVSNPIIQHIVGAIKTPLVNIIDLLRTFGIQFTNAFKINDAVPIINWIINGFASFGQGLKFTSTETLRLGWSFRTLLEFGKDLVKIFKEVFGFNSGNVKKFGEWIRKFITDVGKKIIDSKKTFESIKRSFKNVMEIAKFGVDIIKTAIQWLIPLGFTYLPKVVEVCTMIIEKITDVGVALKDAIENSELLKNVWKDFKTIIEFVLSIFGNIGDNIIDIFGKDSSVDGGFIAQIEEFFNRTYQFINKGLGDLSLDSLDFSGIKTFWNSLMEFLGFKSKENPEEAEQKVNFIEKVIGLALSIGNKIGTFLGGKTADILSDEGAAAKAGSIVDFIKGIAGKITDALGSIWDEFKALDADHLNFIEKIITDVSAIIVSFIIAVGSIFSILATSLGGMLVTSQFTSAPINAIKGIVTEIKDIAAIIKGSDIKKIATNLGALGEGAEKVKKGVFNAQNFIDILNGIAKIILAFSVFAVVASLVDWSKVWQGIGAITVMGFLIGGLMIGMAILQKKMDMMSKKTLSFGGFKFGKGNGRKYLMSDSSKGDILNWNRGSEGPFGDIATAILMVAAGLSIIGLSLSVLSASIAIFKEKGADFQAIDSAVGALALITGLIGLILLVIPILTKSFDLDLSEAGNQMVKMGAAFTLIGIGLAAMSAALIGVSLAAGANPNGLQIAVSTFIAFMGLTAVLLAAAVAVCEFGKNQYSILISGAGLFLALTGLANGVLGFAIAITLITKVADLSKVEQAKSILKTIGIIIGIFTAIFAALAVVVGLFDEASAAMALAAMLGFAVNFSLIIAFLTAAFAAAAAVLGNAAKYLDAISMAIARIKVMFDAIADMDPEKAKNLANNFGEAGKALARGVIEFFKELAHAIIRKAEPIAVGMVALAKVLVTILYGVISAVFNSNVGGVIVGSIASMFNPAENPAAAGAVSAALQGTMDWITEFLNGLSLTNLLNAVWNKAVEIIKFVSAKIKENTEKAVEWLVDEAKLISSSFAEAFEARKEEFAESFDKIVDTVGYLLSKAFNGENFKAVLNDIGDCVVAGLTGGIYAASPVLGGVLTNLALGGTTALRKAWKIESPSKVMQEIGTFLVKGLQKGIEGGANGGIIEAIKQMIPDDAKDKLKEKAKDIFGVFGLDADMNPIITPQLDLSQIVNGLTDMNSLFNGSDLTQIMGIQGALSNQPSMKSMIDGMQANYNDMLGKTVYSLGHAQQNPVPVNVNVTLEGDADQMLRVVQNADRRYTISHGRSAFAR